MVIKAVISYNGRLFLGFERQKEGRTVQGELEKVLSEYFGSPVSVRGSGRTDAGVNAVGQVVSFCPPREISDFERERKAIDSRLPYDLSLVSIEEAPASFDPRRNAKFKIYAYLFSFKERDVLRGGIAYLRNESKFSIERFRSALSLFVGKHDFSSFTPKKEDGLSFYRTIASIDVLLKDGVYSAVFKGTGFMTYMVRFIVGAALRVGFGEMEIGEISSRLDSAERRIISYKAPAEGLTVVYVGYDED